MNISMQIAAHLRQVHFGGNWTSVCLKDALAGITWEQATQKVQSLNSIVALVYHINYYINAVSRVLEGHPLNAHDKYSFDHPPLSSAADWEALQSKVWSDAERMAAMISEFPDNRLQEIFVEEKYGTWYRNFQGIIEHTHYHLGQIIIVKKMI